VVSGGASGAVFGVFGALLAAIWRERQILRGSEFRWLLWGAFAFTGANLAFGLLMPGIDNGAHIGGLLAGAVAGAGLLPRQDKWISALCAALLAMAAAGLFAAVPEPEYSWRSEQQARKEIGSFIWEDKLLNHHLEAVIGEGRRRRLTFDEIANRIDHEVADAYEQSFDALSSIQLGPEAPSSAVLESLRRYAGQRRDASRELAEALRKGDQTEAVRALGKANAARVEAAKPPTGNAASPVAEDAGNHGEPRR
jgi:rhomboid protease GluP